MIWEKLNRFTQIEQFKSLSEAARSGKMSQSTWSRDIKKLEKTFGYRLVFRNYSGIKLTQKGENLLQLINSFKRNLNNFKSTN